MMQKQDTPINSTELDLKANTTQSILLGDSDDEMPQEESNLFLRLCKSDVFAVSAELLKTSKIAIQVPSSSFKSGVLKSTEILKLIREDVDDPQLQLSSLRYWDPKLSAFVKFSQTTKINPGHFLMNCLDIVWEQKAVKESLQDSPPSVPPLKQYFSMLDEGELPISQKVFNLEYRLNLTDEKLENLLAALAREEIIVLNNMENQELQSDGSMTTIKGLTPANRTISAPGLIAINSSRLTLGMDGSDPTLKNQHSMALFDKKKLHFAILYSHPLLEVNMNPGAQKETFGILQNEPVNFSVECDSILETIRAKKKMVNVHIESASQEKFIKMIRDKPTVLHVMCHGSYDNKTSEFFLEFENEYSALLRLTPKILRECLEGQDLSSIRLVFLNACHSEGVGRVFFEFGVKCLVVVNMNHKIDDEYATVFSNNFYSNLLEGQTIQSAFDNAKSDLRTHKKVHPSCCCHHDHQPWCLWAESLKDDGIERAHSKHEQICQCPHADLCIHKATCRWKEEFEEVFEHPDHPNEFKVPAPQHKGSFRICCCRADLPHDESMKLMLLFNENKAEYGQECIFTDLRDGTYQLINKDFYQSVSFHSVSVIGQNKLLYSMIKHFFIDDAKVLYICGPAGSGKSTVCKAFSNFVQERHKFSKFAHKKLSSSDNSASLVSKIFGFVYLKDVSKDSKLEDRLMLFENADALIKENPEAFDEQINELVESTKIRFLIEITNRSILEKRKKPRKYEYVLNVPGLKDLDAAKFVKNHLTSIHVSLTQWEKDVYNMKTLDVFQKEWTPKDLLDLAMRINTEKQDFKVICNNFLLEKQKQMAIKPSQNTGPKDEEEEDRIIIECLQ